MTATIRRLAPLTLIVAFAGCAAPARDAPVEAGHAALLRTAAPADDHPIARRGAADPSPGPENERGIEPSPAGGQPPGVLAVDPTVQRYPWGPLFDAAAAAADCLDPTPGARWWCGGREPAAAVDGDACPDESWLAFRLTEAPCPPVSGFALSTPFAGTAHPDLERLCRYRWTHSTAPVVTALLPDGPDLRVERDCRVLGAHGVPEAVWRPLETAWFTQLSLPDYGPDPDPAVGTTRVAVLDSTPGSGFAGGPSTGETSTHGLSVGNAIRAIACPAARDEDGPCAAALAYQLALPRAYGQEDPPRGGAFGTQGEFTAAVVAALHAWKADPAAPRMVMNLSIGWTPMHGGDVSDTGRFVPQTGLWAVDLAACEGALVIAAAGNRSHADAEGATYPAAWTAEPSLCDASRPSIYAVGGVDGDDTPLSIGRPGSLPRLLAPASQVIVADERFGFPFSVVPLSGTSLAAAAASGAAALVWAWRPDLDAAAVMATLYEAGAPLVGFAEVDLQGAVPRRRLDVCAAVSQACADGSCAVAPPACPGRPADARPDDATLLPLMHPAAVDVLGAPVKPAIGEDVADAPYAVPQPTVSQCPYCGITGGLLYGTLVSDPGAVLVSSVLEIDDGLGGVAIPLPDLPQGAPFKLPVGYNGEVKGAWLKGQLAVNGKIVDTAAELVLAH